MQNPLSKVKLEVAKFDSRWGGRRKLPNAFTEQGVAMLSNILNGDVAIEVNKADSREYNRF